MRRLGGLVAVGALAGLACAYPRLLRPAILTWGASAEEAAAPLPGDELLPDPDRSSTRAITIDAPPDAVWPWLVQMGPAPRAGAYTYDWIENLLGLDMHSADRVLPEFQEPRLGEEIGYGQNRMRVALVEPPRAFAWLSADGNWLWSFVLEERSGGTRLLSRNRFNLPSLGARAAMVPVEIGSLPMERKMLLGIRERAERLGRERQPGG